MDNQQIAEVFEEIAELLALQDANPFRIRAYRNAARTLRGEEHPLAERVAAGQALPKLPGIGHDLTERIVEMARSGECQLLNRLRREVPAGLGELLQLPGIGPKRAHQLYHELGVDSLAALREALAGRSETDIYQALGLPPIPPELREDTGERNSTRSRSAPISTSAAAGWPSTRACS